jgi:transposase-like protein
MLAKFFYTRVIRTQQSKDRTHTDASKIITKASTGFNNMRQAIEHELAG